MTDELTVMAREVATKLSKYDGIKSADFVIAKDEVTLNCEVRGWGTVSSSHWHGWFSQYCNELGTDWVAEVYAREIQDKITYKLGGSSYFHALSDQLSNEGLTIKRLRYHDEHSNQIVFFIRLAAKDNSYFVDVVLDNLLLCSVKEAAERISAFVNSEKVRTDLANAQVAFKRLFEHYGVEPYTGYCTVPSNSTSFAASCFGRQIILLHRNLVGMSGKSADEMFEFLVSKVEDRTKRAIFEVTTANLIGAMGDDADSDRFLLEMSKAVSSVAALS